MSFRFPYNFFPVTGKINKVEIRYPFDYKKSADENCTADIARHDVLHEDSCSGSIDFTIEAISPLVVGSSQNPESSINIQSPPNIISQYRWRGKNALPANSIRGLVASTAELLSQSTLRVLHGKFFKSFKAINPDLVPWKSGRNNITVAEALFGFVDSNSDSSENLASRVIFHDATTDAKVEEEPIYLQELSGPKYDGRPGSDGIKFDDTAYNHYFRLADGEPAQHQDIANIDDLLPNGRKFYLKRGNLRPINYQAQKKKIGDYNKDYRNRVVKVTPLPKGSQFTGKVTFTNLSKAELTLLHKSLSPSENTIHQIGMAKSLGLGQIKVKIDKLTIIDNKKRYGLKAISDECLIEKKIGDVDDTSLIDTDSLIILTKMGNEDSLVNAKTVKWRNGQNQKTRPIPKITTTDEEAPIANEHEEHKKQQASNKPPEKKKQDHGALMADDTVAAKWIRDKLTIINNNQDISFLPGEEFKKLLTGQALSKAYYGIPDDIKKDEIKEKLFSEFKIRNLRPADFSEFACKKYFGSLDIKEIP